MEEADARTAYGAVQLQSMPGADRPYMHLKDEHEVLLEDDRDPLV